TATPRRPIPALPTGHVLTMRPLAEWEQANPGTVHDPEWFRRDVLPRLERVKLSDIVEAAGLLEGVASNIRRGKWTPHVST
ncbi:MAG: hypothetical protein ABR972_15880, partial [Acidimicrobiales bacterium]